MSTALVLAGLWIAFGGSHIALSSQRWRPVLVAALGLRGFQLLYSAIALAIFVPLVAVYFGDKHAGPHLVKLGDLPFMRVLVYVGMGAALSLLIGGLLRPSPASVVPGSAQARGVFHVTRHPVLMSFGLFGLLHLCAVAVNAAELVFFAGFPLFVLIGSRHQDQRKLASGAAEFRRFYDATPWLPFSRPAGVLAAVREQPVAIALGVAATVVLRWFHPQWFGPA